MKLNGKSLLGMTAISLAISSCGLFGERPPEYYGVSEARPLEVPERLDNPTAETALIIESPPMPLAQRELNDVPPRILANQSDSETNSQLRWSADGVYIYVEDSTESVERRLGYVIERSGMNMRGRGSVGGYLFEYHHVHHDRDEGWFSWAAFWRDDPPDYSGTYQTESLPDGGNTRVFVRYADGEEVPMEAAEHVLAILKERLG